MNRTHRLHSKLGERGGTQSQSFLFEPASSRLWNASDGAAFRGLLSDVFDLAIIRAAALTATAKASGACTSRSAVLQAAYGSLVGVLDRRQPRRYARCTLSTFAGSGPGGRGHDMSPVPAGESGRGALLYEVRHRSHADLCQVQHRAADRRGLLFRMRATGGRCAGWTTLHLS